MRFQPGEKVWHYFSWISPPWQLGTVTDVPKGSFDYRNVHFPAYPYGDGRWSVPASKLISAVPYAFAGIPAQTVGDKHAR